MNAENIKLCTLIISINKHLLNLLIIIDFFFIKN